MAAPGPLPDESLRMEAALPVLDLPQIWVHQSVLQQAAEYLAASRDYRLYNQSKLAPRISITHPHSKFCPLYAYDCVHPQA